MPYKIVKQGEKFCVAKKDSGTLVKGGCHASRNEAVDHLQAIMASETSYAILDSFTEEDSNSELAYNSEGESLWEGYIAFEGVSTGDNRSFASGSITWGDLPVPLLWQKLSSDGHSGSWVIGRVDHIEKQDGGKVFATGVLLDTPEANEYKLLLESGSASGVSIDGDTAAYQVEEGEGEEKGKHKITFSAIRIRALTAVAVPAFADAKIRLSVSPQKTIELTDEVSEEFCDDITDGNEAELLRKKRKKMSKTWTYSQKDADILLAAGAPIKPPVEWFNNQNLPGPTPLTVLDDGQVFGHIALWGTCHIGMPACTAPPKGGSYAYFHTGALRTAEEEEISVGHLTFNTGHADVYGNAAIAASHYDHTGAVAADVVAGEDKYGIWVAGAMRPHLTEEEVRIFKSAPISGDWRRIGARLELVAALSVNTPGFPVPRTKVLVASGADATFITLANQGDFESFGRQAYKDDLVERLTHTLSSLETLDGADVEELAKRKKRKETIGHRAMAWAQTSDSVELDPNEPYAPGVEDADGFPASDYALVPDREDPATWKLRLTSEPNGDPDARTVAAVVAYLGKGFFGTKVELSDDSRPQVIAKVRAAFLKANPDRTQEDLPPVLRK